MKLYHSPFSCSQAPHIALAEAGLAFDLVKVDIPTRLLDNGKDFTAINPKGYVPALELDGGGVLTENPAILSWIADQAPSLLPPGELGRIRHIEMLSFLASEVHKPFLAYMFMPGDEAKPIWKAAIEGRFALLADQLDGNFLFGETFVAADTFLFVMASWAIQHRLRVEPKIVEYHARVGKRSAVAEVVNHERGMFSP